MKKREGIQSVTFPPCTKEDRARCEEESMCLKWEDFNMPRLAKRVFQHDCPVKKGREACSKRHVTH